MSRMGLTGRLFLCLIACMGVMGSCTAPVPVEPNPVARNDIHWFPKRPFTDIYVARVARPGDAADDNLILTDGSLAPAVVAPLHKLSPAHRADVGVALALCSSAYISQRCYYPRHAVIWKSNQEVIGVLGLCFQCNTYRFEPESKVDLRDVNLNRLKLVFEETGLLDPP